MRFEKTTELDALMEELSSTFDDNLWYSDVLNAYFGLEHRNDASFFSSKKGAISPDLFSEYLVKTGLLAKSDKESFASICLEAGSIRELNPDDYLSDPYFKILDNVTIKDGDIELGKLSYSPFEVFLADAEGIDESTGVERVPLGYFRKRFSYPALIQNGEVWMSLIPHEIETMKEAIKKAKGRVLTLGLGLGYYAYSVAIKEDVESVTVVELDKRIIDIFETYIKPNIPFGDKIHIIHADAIRYCKENVSKYDYVFADIWRTSEDGLPLYFKLVEACKEKGFDAWILEAIKAFFARIITHYVISSYESEKTMISNYARYFGEGRCDLLETIDSKILRNKGDLLKLIDIENLLRNSQ